MEPSLSDVLIIEPFYGGSHKQLVDRIVPLLEDEGRSVRLCTMSAKKWHWRARVSALCVSEEIPKTTFRYLFTSSVLSLAELLGLRPDLLSSKKIVYFHENQLVYPVRESKDRDFQYGYNQINTSLVADLVVFNSDYNLRSFLDNIKGFLKLMPDYRPKKLEDRIRKKSIVLYFPIEVPLLPSRKKVGALHIIWNHRWEHDKNPEDFFSALLSLHERGCDFQLSVIGESFTDNPPIFEEMKMTLQSHICGWGYLESKEEYFRTLVDGDVVVSTAKHEFFGVAMIEAVCLGCYPLCPNRLVYPEIFPPECIYNTQNQLVKTLTRFCRYPDAARAANLDFRLGRFDWKELGPKYAQLFSEMNSQ